MRKNPNLSALERLHSMLGGSRETFDSIMGEEAKLRAKQHADREAKK